MICSHCEKEFTPKRETAKYCSDNCRVKAYNKRVGIKAKPPLQMQVLMTRLENALEKIEGITLPSSAYGIVQNQKIGEILNPEPMFTPKLKIKRSYSNYQQLKLDCENIEAWEELKAEILASDLTTKEKTLLTT